MPRDLPGSSWRPLARGTGISRQDCSAFLFGALLVYLSGIAARAAAFPNPWIGVAFSLLIDTFALTLVLANRRLLKIVQRWFQGTALSAFILASSSTSALIVILVIRLLGTVLPYFASPWSRLPFAQFVYFAYMFIAWAVAGRWLDERSKAQEDRLRAITAQNAMIRAEMQQLRMQRNPHFVFNALNMLAVNIHDRPKRALLMLRELNRYLRYSLDNAESAFVPASREVAGMRAFMRVQEMRYGSSLKSSITVKGSLRRHLLPTFLLQPLLENATKHGLPGPDGTLSVSVEILAEPSSLTVIVTNDGDLETPSGLPGTGTGLTSLRRRLAMHYPGQHSLSLTQEEDMVVFAPTLRGPPC